MSISPVAKMLIDTGMVAVEMHDEREGAPHLVQ
jgi:hypothetical protein